MNTTPCPACRKQMSTKALLCASCGHPLRRSFGDHMRLVFGGILVLLLLCFIWAVWAVETGQ